MPSPGQFIAARRERWAALEALLARSEGRRGAGALSASDVETLGRRYRELVSDLAIARRDFPEDQVTNWLNALAARAHLRLYRAPAGSWRRLVRFFTVDFARRVRAARGPILLAAALLLLPAVWAYVASLRSEAMRRALVPEQLLEIMSQGHTWTEMAPVMRPAMAALIFTNNIQVSFLVFAGGVTAGLLTVYALVRNGLLLGAVLGAAQHYGVLDQVGGFVSSHGYLELSLIVLSAAAGLQLGGALLWPGLLRRQDAITRAGRQALALALGTAPLFVLAGLVEGFVSPSSLPLPVKLALGPLLMLVIAILIARLSRTPAPSPT